MNKLRERTITSMASKKNKNQISSKKWTNNEISKIVTEILMLDEIPNDIAVPIVRISGHFSIKVYKEKFESNTVSMILVNGNTKKMYKKERVIIVEESANLYYQRYLVAIELGKYVLEYFGSSMYKNKEYYFHKLEKKIDEKTKRFAAEILMPTYSFLRQYLIITRYYNFGKMMTVEYLSRFFEVPNFLVIERIQEIVNS